MEVLKRTVRQLAHSVLPYGGKQHVAQLHKATFEDGADAIADHQQYGQGYAQPHGRFHAIWLPENIDDPFIGHI